MAFSNPIVAGEELVISGIHSDNYKESQAGWRIARDGSAQFNSINLLGDIGTIGQISADSFQVGPGGLYLPSGENGLDLLDGLRWDQNPDSATHPYGPMGPKGLVAFYEDLGLPGTYSGSETGVFATRFICEPYRAYRITVNLRIRPSVKSDGWACRLRYTSGTNTVPTTSSSTLRDLVFDRSPDSADSEGWLEAYHLELGGSGPNIFWVGAFLLRYGGTGTATIVSDSSNHATIMVEDIGPAPMVGDWLTRQNVADTTPSGGYGQTYAAPSTPPPTQTTYTKTYQPSWSRTYDGDNTTTWDDSAHCYQGYYSSDRGNTRSLVGYNYTQIMSDLSGATIVYTKLTFKVAHAYYNAGMTVEIGGHNYTSKPSTWNGSNVTENQTSRASSVAGSTYTVTLPSSFGTNFKSGTWKGISFGPGPSTSLTYYGYLYGATETGKPYLTIQYKK